ncbi:ice-binding family protein [Patiriisocius sp. Uisw_017]|uniref:ice-binding family protein n=1 Tax=Patiriisocius sp. Uisw_017 TaxID=3230968 RepID=UPI0039E98724
MKFIKKSPILAILFMGLMSSCSPEMESLELEEANLIITQSKSLILPVGLGDAGNFAILSKSGMTNVPPSVITGNVGTSPITGAALLLTCPQVIGDIYTADAAGPLPCRVTDAPGLTTAVLNMQAAYTDAAGRSNPDYLNVGAGIIGGLTLAPGLHKWTSTLLIPTDITISGGPDDVWIFQVAGTLTMSSAVRMNLEGGAQASNIFWQVSDAVTLGTTSHFEGNLLGATSISVQTEATVNGRLLAQTAVTLQMNTVTIPVPAKVGVACEKANLNYYGPYVDIQIGNIEDNQNVLLSGANGGFVFIENTVLNEWEFTIFDLDYTFPCDNNLLPCDNSESCEFAFTISAEDAAILMDEALALQLELERASTTNKSSTDGLILLNK